MPDDPPTRQRRHGQRHEPGDQSARIRLVTAWSTGRSEAAVTKVVPPVPAAAVPDSEGTVDRGHGDDRALYRRCDRPGSAADAAAGRERSGTRRLVSRTCPPGPMTKSATLRPETSAEVVALRRSSLAVCHRRVLAGQGRSSQGPGSLSARSTEVTSRSSISAVRVARVTRASPRRARTGSARAPPRRRGRCGC